MMWPTFPGSRAMKRRIAQWSANWIEAPDVSATEKPSSPNAQQQLSLSTREVVESLKLQRSNERHAEPHTR